MIIHARSLLALAAHVLLGLAPAPRHSCGYRARGPRDLDRHAGVCPWERLGEAS